MKKLFILFIFIGSCITFASRYTDLELFAYTLNIIKSHYVEPIKTKQLVHGAIQGLLRELDPHSQFFTPKKFKQFKDKGSGVFYGIGVELEKKDGFLTVISVLPRSPAKKAGFKEGDKIISLNNKAVKSLTLQEFLQNIQNRRSSTCKIVVFRGDKTIPLKVRLRTVKIQPVQFKKMENQIGYLRIYQFTDLTLYYVKKALKSKPIKGLILDLRSNPGGAFEEAVKVSDLFLNTGTIVSLKTRSGENNKSFKANLSTTLFSIPLVVLINEYSASASEIVAGALKDHKRAILMGRKSFGKGSVQNVFPLPRDYALKLTIGEYHTPSGISIHEKGIKPHKSLPIPKIEVNFSLRNTDEDSDIQAALKKLKSLI